MRVLLLSPYGTKLKEILEKNGDEVFLLDGKDEDSYEGNTDCVVMYGWRHILRPHIISAYNRVYNIHNALLPWNRGAHPNFWSWFDETPKGCTIHEVDSGVDTGPILAQSSVYFAPQNETLASSYAELHDAAMRLFESSWPHIRLGKLKGRPQDLTKGSLHKKKELDQYWPLLTDGWDTPVSEVVELGRRVRNGQAINYLDAERGERLAR